MSYSHQCSHYSLFRSHLLLIDDGNVVPGCRGFGKNIKYLLFIPNLLSSVEVLLVLLPNVHNLHII